MNFKACPFNTEPPAYIAGEYLLSLPISTLYMHLERAHTTFDQTRIVLYAWKPDEHWKYRLHALIPDNTGYRLVTCDDVGNIYCVEPAERFSSPPARLLEAERVPPKPTLLQDLRPSGPPAAVAPETPAAPLVACESPSGLPPASASLPMRLAGSLASVLEASARRLRALSVST